MLRRLGVRGKILATLAVPVLVLSLAAVFLSGSAVSDARLAESNQQIVDALDAQDFMTRAMQKERSAAFAVGGQAEGAEAAYRFARVDTHRAIAALETRLDEVDLGPVDDRLVDTIRAASGARSPERLESVRRLLSTNAMTSTKTVQTLRDIIDSQMAVSETASNRMDDVRLTELLNGYTPWTRR